MGFGGLIGAGAQNSLANLQESVNSIGGTMQYQEANQQASALQTEAGDVFQQSLVEASREQIQGTQTLGQQQEQYASAGVDMSGSPLTMLNQTRMETEQQSNLILQQGQEQQSLLLTQADLTQQQGLAAYMSAQGENQATTQQTDIEEDQEKAQLEEQFFSGVLGLGGGAIDSAMPTLLKMLTT